MSDIPAQELPMTNVNQTVITKKRGRPRANKTPDEISNSRVELSSDRMAEAHNPKRPARVPMGATLKLSFGSVCDDPKYHFHVFSDRDGRIQQSKQAWYEHVKDENGDNVTRHSGPFTQYLMKVEKKYWDKDQKLKQDRLSAKIQGEQKLAKDEYLPDGRHHVLQKDDYDPLG